MISTRQINSTFFFKLICLFLLSLSQCKAESPQKIQSKFIMITTLYNETNAERLQEYITCMEKNLRHKAIDEIVVLYDSSKDDDQNKMLNYLKSICVKIHYIKGRPTYQYCFDYANKVYADARIILTNADIYFNGTLWEIINFNLENKFLALNRWDVKIDGSLRSFEDYSEKEKGDALFSQDVWLFKTPIRQFKNAQFELGTYACDCYIANEAYRVGLQVSNPCLSVQACHLHLSQLRRWTIKTIDGAFALPIPRSSLKNFIFYQIPQ